MTTWEPAKLRAGFDHRGHQCNACGMHHCHIQVIGKGPKAGELVDEPEYEGWSGAGWQIGLTDKEAITWLNTRLDRACLDVNEFGWVCGWVMECMEKGYLTEKQVGFKLAWGDVDGAYRLIQMISHREGFGDLLAEGVKRASEKIGGEAAKCAVYTKKGASPRGHDHRGRWEEMLDTCTSSNGTMESANATHQTEIGLPGRINPFNGEEVARMVGGILGRKHFEDSLGGCIFTFRTRIEMLARALSAATGWTYTLADAMRLGRRTAAILRAFNLRCGIGTDVEYPVGALRLAAGGRAGQGPQHHGPVGAHARGLVRDGRLRHQDRQAHARDAQEARPRLAREGSVAQVGSTPALSVTVEVTTWVTKHVGGDGSGSKVLHRALRARRHGAATSCGAVSARFPELDAALWSPDHAELGEHIEVVVNDAVLGVTHELDSPLKSGERITLLGQFMGG